MFLHNRNTGGDFVRLLCEHKHKAVASGVVHSFDGSLQEAQEIIQLGFNIGINGCSLKTEENLQVVKEIPVESLMIETDAPWCDIRPTHASFKHIKKEIVEAFETKKKERFELGKMVKGRNEPCTIRYLIEFLWILLIYLDKSCLSLLV